MTWQYRVIHKNGEYAVHEVYYDDQGEPWTCTQEPVCPKCETLEELRVDLEHYTVALDLPVLHYTDLVPDHQPPQSDVELLPF
jgi:hypothetical protein